MITDFQIEIIYNIVIIIFISYLSACATHFIDFCIGEPHYGEVHKGRIFSGYGRYILRKYLEIEKKNNFFQNQKLNWYKALGVCHVCLNVYLTFIVGLSFYLFFDQFFISILPEIFISSRFLRKFHENN